MRKYKREVSGTNVCYKFEGTNKLGESLVVEVYQCAESIVKMWKKGKLIDKDARCISADTFVTDAKGNCYGRYNPTCIYGKNSRNGLIGSWVNFEWIVKTEDEIIAEVVRQFEAAKISK